VKLPVPLDQALRWREQCVLLEEARLACLGARVAAVRTAQEVWEKDADAAARGLRRTVPAWLSIPTMDSSKLRSGSPHYSLRGKGARAEYAAG